MSLKGSGKASYTRRQEELNVVIVGDGGCGKTSLLMVYSKGDFPEKYVPSAFEKSVASVRYRGQQVHLNLYDTAGRPRENDTDFTTASRLYRTAHTKITEFSHDFKSLPVTQTDPPGQEAYDRLRPLSYQSVNLVIICYDVMCPSSFDNVLIKWYPEVHHFCRGVPIILVGCKADLRKDKVLAKKLWSTGQNAITYIQGEDTKRKINAELYLECSAKSRDNVEDIFREATKRALAATTTSRKVERSSCALL